MTNSTVLSVRMLGEFSICRDGAEINDGDNRSRKLWLLLAYMIYCRRAVSQDELIRLLWGENESSSNPGNALKTMFHRVRTMLNQLGADAGHTMIVRMDGSYAWNPEFSFSFDAESFETLCGQAASLEGEARLETQLQALALYRGDFLPKLSAELWVVPISAYFHNLYIHTVLEAADALETADRAQEAAALCRKAIAIEPYDEALYQHLMRALVALDDQKGAVAVYQNMSELLFSNFGVMPSDESKALYRECARTVNEREVSLGSVREQLKEPSGSNGALFCDYDFFTILYHAEARAMARSGDAVHIGLLGVTDENGNELAKRSLDVCMGNLQEMICSCLRKGDIASRCSVSQFIVMLPQANYENACMVMDRVVRSFRRQYPHSPARLHFSVQPLEPNA